MNPGDLAGRIEHTLLRPDARRAEIEALCEEAVKYAFHAVCVNPFHAGLASGLLGGSGVRVVSVVGFPLGMTLTEVKVYEAMELELSGASELDVVMNVGCAKSGRWDAVERDLSDVISATRRCVHKVIIETCLLGRAEKKMAVEAALRAGADFIKTSTGFSEGGATLGDVRLIKGFLAGRAAIKASGGISSLGRAVDMIKAGADRIGTSSGGKIMEEAIRASSNRGKKR